MKNVTAESCVEKEREQNNQRKPHASRTGTKPRAVGPHWHWKLGRNRRVFCGPVCVGGFLLAQPESPPVAGTAQGLSIRDSDHFRLELVVAGRKKPDLSLGLEEPGEWDLQVYPVFPLQPGYVEVLMPQQSTPWKPSSPSTASI